MLFIKKIQYKTIIYKLNNQKNYLTKKTQALIIKNIKLIDLFNKKT